METVIFTAWNVSSVGSEHYFDRVGVTGSSPVRSTNFLSLNILFVLIFSLFVQCLSYGQPNYTVIYSHHYGVDFNTKGGSSSFNRDEALYINNDSICFFEFQYDETSGPKSVIGNEDSHHAVYTLLKTANYLYETSLNKVRYLAKDTIKKYQWVLFNDSMDICGFKCFKAEADSVIAWYTPEIKVSSGPAYYSRLPGLILQITDLNRKWLVTARKVIDAAPLILFPEKMEIIPYDKIKRKRN